MAIYKNIGLHINGCDVRKESCKVHLPVPAKRDTVENENNKEIAKTDSSNIQCLGSGIVKYAGVVHERCPSLVQARILRSQAHFCEVARSRCVRSVDAGRVV